MNIEKARERIDVAVKNKDKIAVLNDIDMDGVAATVLIVNYLKALDQDVEIIYKERKQGHGVVDEDIPDGYDLLIIVDSSSTEVEEVNKVSKRMDVLILDHHPTTETSETLNAILVNPNQAGCGYPNKDISGAGVTYRFIEVLDFYYKKVNIKHYLDLFGLSILSDVMSLSSMENRYFLNETLRGENIHNKGLLALINASRNDKNSLSSQVLNFDIIPVINTTVRNNEIKKAFSLLFEEDYFKALDKVKYLIKENKERKQRIAAMAEDVEVAVEDAKFAYVVTEEGFGEYNGLVATKLSNQVRKPVLILKEKDGILKGSARSYGGFKLNSFVNTSNLFEYALGHEGAFGCGIKSEKWEEFKQYVDDNIDESMFESDIVYDIELTEDDFDWDMMDSILEFDRLYGNSSPKVSVKLKNIFVEDRQVFPPKNPSHVKIVTDKLDLLAFNDSEYAKDVDVFDEVDAVGTVSINEFNGSRRMQLIIDDYIKND